jgi:sialic acid synthase SpsE
MKKIIKKIFDQNCPPILIAEISANHNGSFKNAKKININSKKKWCRYC